MASFTRHVPFKCQLPPCSDQDIRTLEVYYGAALPENYRNFLLQFNGALFDQRVVFPIMEPKNLGFAFGDITVLWGLVDPLNEYDLRHWIYRDGRDFKDRVPDHIKMIGHGSVCGDLTISLGPDDFGSLYFWDPMMDWDDPSTYRKDYDGLELCARSFSAWWESLRYRPGPGFSYETGEYEAAE